MLDRQTAEQVARDLNFTFDDLRSAIQKGEEASTLFFGNIFRSVGDNPEKLKAWDVLFAEMNRTDPVYCKQLIAQLRVKSTTLEMMGYEPWLRTLGPHTFTGSFADAHHEMWGWYWPIIAKLRRGIPLDLEDLVFIAAWPRDYGKSSHAEWIAIAEGAMVSSGYILYVCRVQAQAEEHVLSIRNRIESEKVAATYPRLGKPKMGTHGNRFGWGREFVMTSGGVAFRPMGLDVAARGGKVLDVRPSLIILGDIDKINDSLAVVESNSQTIQREILPMGTPQTRILVEQNPIHSASWVSNVLNRVTDALAVRRVSGPIPAYKDIKIEFRQTEHGPRNVIVGGSPTWKDMSLEKCQAFLDRSGLDAFKAEYLHDFSAEQDERVLPEYDDRILRLHVITWSQFIGMYFEGVDNPPRRIPNYWPCSLGGDIGYTAGHLSAFSWLTRAPENAPLSGSIFRYRGLTFSGAAPDDIGAHVRNALWPARGEYKGELAQIIQQVLSHEALGERLLLNGKFGFSFMPCDKGKESGLPQWRHHLRPDRSQKHPFHRDELLPDGTWKLGRPGWFDIVADDQFIAPQDDAGMKTHRNTAFTWRRKKVKLTEAGLTKDQPMKIDDDPNDSTRSQLASGMMGPPIIPLTHEEKLVKAIPKNYDWNSLQARVKAGQILPEQAQMTFERSMRRAEKIVGRTQMPEYDEYGQALAE